MSKIIHYAFRQEYSYPTPRLITEAEAVGISGTEIKKVKVNALWDTGAKISAITPLIASELKLIPFDRVKVNGINNSSMADVVKIFVGLPNQVTVNNVNTAVCNLVNGVDLLIGMDIIMLGDFNISNSNGKTHFSFVIPSFKDKIDLYEKANYVNKKDNMN